jgi:tagatose 6-phosphate kinase
MILTVTLNPLLERRLTFERVTFTTGNRNGKLSLKTGGKGINVSRQLSKLKIKNTALTFTGGTNGKLFKDELKKEGIVNSIIQTHSETRECFVILNQSSKKAASFFSENNFVSSTEVGAFISQMEKMISNCEIVVFSGSSPCKETNIIFPIGIELANKLGKISLCDTYGKHLKDCLNASPTMVHNNVEEIESSLEIQIKNEKDVIGHLDNLYAKGIKQVFITNGEEDFYCSNFDFHYKVSLPKITTIDSTGSGDAFVAGIIFGWVNRLTFSEQVSFAASLGINNTLSFDVCNSEFDDAKLFVEKIIIEPVGKKIKIIDDSPR